jgi:hypothetical protein
MQPSHFGEAIGMTMGETEKGKAIMSTEMMWIGKAIMTVGDGEVMMG